jgi:hypothetical protein
MAEKEYLYYIKKGIYKYFKHRKTMANNMMKPATNVFFCVAAFPHRITRTKLHAKLSLKTIKLKKPEVQRVIGCNLVLNTS